MRILFASALAAFALAAAAPMTAPDTTGGWRALFEGKTTAGWRGFRQKQMPDGWQVVDGALTRVARATDIVTSDQFGDFELTLEWKLPSNGNSGIFYRVTEDDDVMWHTAPEFQLRAEFRPSATRTAIGAISIRQNWPHRRRSRAARN